VGTKNVPTLRSLDAFHVMKEALPGLEAELKAEKKK
jgi:hypothetical protein